jgi:V/A-type H+-transporting ATPase subunit D
MAIAFQYNKTALQGLEKQLRIRERALPTIKSKENALRLEAKRTKDEMKALEDRLENDIRSYESMSALWSEFDPALVRVDDVALSAKKIAGVITPMLDRISFSVKSFSLFNRPDWFMDGITVIKTLVETGIEIEFTALKLHLLERARRKTTQKLNLFEKVQIPGYKDAILKIKRFMEDEESLSKSSQKIMRASQERRKMEEEVS